MKRWVVGGLLCLWIAGVTPRCEASMVSQAVGNLWGYLFSPINCVANLSVEVLGSGARFVQCVLSNANPARIIP